MTASLIVGTSLALAALAIVLYPLFYPREEPLQPERRPFADTAADPVEAALRAYLDSHPACPVCGPRPEAGAEFCSNCGRRLSVAGQPGS